ncbi:MAG TPA: twin-arginine translocase TatA/TatE family subunit [Candidatus Brocadiia bacterium]|nr:twin-arginine translocase TatA/TatE family subunit [Candidatus Brocadiia bacterium]
MMAFISMPGGMEWMVILIIALLVFGKRLPEVMRSLGKGVSEFKKGVHGVEDEAKKVVDDVQSVPQNDHAAVGNGSKSVS